MKSEDPHPAQGRIVSREQDPYEIDLTQDYPEPTYTLNRNGIGFMTRGDIHAVKAKSKNGKSLLCQVFIATLLGSKDYGMEAQEANPVILYFDTEQDISDTVRMARRIHKMMHWSQSENRPQLHVYHLRAMDEADRLPYIDRKAEETQATHVFIDGIADLNVDFNDEHQSKILIDHLMKLSARLRCAIVNVLHTNKAKDNSDMKGHLGTLLLQKAADVFEVKKENGCFNVEMTDARHKHIEPFSFSVDADCIPFATATVKEEKNAARFAEMRRKLSKAFNQAKRDVLTYTELAMMYAQANGVSKRAGEMAIKTACDNDILTSKDFGYTLVTEVNE